MNVSEMLRWSTNSQSTEVFSKFTSIVVESIIADDSDDDETSKVRSQLAQELKSLDGSALVRIVTAPETYTRAVEAAKGRAATLLAFLRTSIYAERARTGQIDQLGEPCWSALGDYYHPADRVSKTFGPNRCGDWRSNEPYQSPFIFNSVPVDFVSPYARRNLPVASFRPVQFGPYVRYPNSDMQVAMEKLRRASECLNEINPIVANFVRQFARSIVARKDDENSDFYTSSSCNAYIGRIVLINPHLLSVDESALIDSLVHESIHSLLWRCEVLSPFIADTSQVKGTTRSPWTQSELHLYTFLQACFVWYGLLTFWNLPETTRVFGQTLVRKYLSRAQRGFLDNQVIDNVVKFKNALRPGLLEELGAMQSSACQLD